VWYRPPFLVRADHPDTRTIRLHRRHAIGSAGGACGRSAGEGSIRSVGFRGTIAEEAAAAISAIAEHHVGGALLFDYDSPTRTPMRNIVSPRPRSWCLRSATRPVTIR